MFRHSSVKLKNVTSLRGREFVFMLSAVSVTCGSGRFSTEFDAAVPSSISISSKEVNLDMNQNIPYF